MNKKPLPHYYKRALEEMEMKEKHLFKYFLEYKLKPLYRNIFIRSFSESLLENSFDRFCIKYSNYPQVSEFDNSFRDYDEYLREYELSTEISELCKYWFNRNGDVDRVKDDQMLIRLIRIRHKLPY